MIWAGSSPLRITPSDSLPARNQRSLVAFCLREIYSLCWIARSQITDSNKVTRKKRHSSLTSILIHGIAAEGGVYRPSPLKIQAVGSRKRKLVHIFNFIAIGVSGSWSADLLEAKSEGVRRPRCSVKQYSYGHSKNAARLTVAATSERRYSNALLDASLWCDRRNIRPVRHPRLRARFDISLDNLRNAIYVRRLRPEETSPYYRPRAGD